MDGREEKNIIYLIRGNIEHMVNSYNPITKNQVTQLKNRARTRIDIFKKIYNTTSI